MFFSQKGNQSIVYNIVTAINQLRKTFGKIKWITGLGRCAQMSINLFEADSIENALESHVDIDHLIVVDRNIDYASLLLSPLNYQGLLDDIFGFKCCN
jgi:vacuolar protein sorting-associated protein 33B